MIFSWKKFIIGLVITFFDIIIYVFLGLVLLNYEDFYTESKGEFWSLASMTIGQKIAYISWFIWYFINFILAVYIVFNFMKKYFAKNPS